MRRDLRLRRRARAVVLALGVLGTFAIATIAWAIWSSGGSGAGASSVTTLAVPTSVSVPGSVAGSNVHVTWTGVNAPSGASDVRYWVRRSDGATTQNACGTSQAAPLFQGVGAKSCDDTGVLTSLYTYTVTAVWHSWTGQSSASGSVAVQNDSTPPSFGSPALTISTTGAFTFASGTSVFYNAQGANSGSFTVVAPNVADPQTGVQKVVFPALTGMTGGGDDTSSPYQSGYSWTAGSTAAGSKIVTAYNNESQTSTTSFTVTPDSSAPTSGSITANGAAPFNATGVVSLAKTDFSDAGSGVASNILTRASGTLAGNVCGTLTGAVAVAITSGNDSSTLATGCYQYTLTGTDQVGNVATVLSTIVKVDRSAPTLSITTTGANVTSSGSTIYFKAAGSGSFTVTAADPDSGVASSNLPVAPSGWTRTPGTNAATYTLAGASASSSLSSVSATNAAGSVTTQTVTITVDGAAPAQVLTFPTVNVRYSNAVWNAGCSSAVCGTATDAASGVQAVEVSVQQGTGNYWNGSAFSSASQVWNTATGTGSWSLPFAATNFPAEGIYTVSVRATDRIGNTSSATSSTFTIDRTAPSVSSVVLANANGQIASGDTITVTFNEAMSVSSMCSVWSGDGSNQSLAGNGDVVVSVTDGGVGNDTLTVTSPSAPCSFNFGTLNLGSPNWVSANTSYSGNGSNKSTIAYNATTRALVITLGTGTAGTSGVAAQTITYAPSSSITDSSGNVVNIPSPFSSQRF